MKIYSWNVNGIRAVEKKGLLQPFLAKHQPDVLCLQETKAQPDQIDLNLDGYELFWHSAEKKGYSGTAIFTKHEPIDVVNGLPEEIKSKYQLTDSYGDTTMEGRIMTAEFEPFYISTVYTPNAKDDLSRIPMRQQWDPAYLQYMSDLQKIKPVIFCGDFNVAHTELDLARPKQNIGKKGFTSEERVGIDNMLKHGFVDTLRHLNPDTPELYTWWSHFGGARERNVGWRIDYVMVSEALVPVIKNARIHPEVLGSDHCPVSIELSVEL
ncbi:exodeoxyribonuclease III [Candidatus Nomurabacteria bacterium]|nr:exodeoxyribonuclease III [Candidatus Nomurabacteria bacterium]